MTSVAEARRILAEAEAVDAQENARFGDARGDELPAGFRNREERLQRLRDARERLAARERERQEDYEERLRSRASKDRCGRRPDRRGAVAIPADPGAVAAYLAERAEGGASASTLAVGRAAIGAAHRDAGEADPTAAEGVARTLAGLRRQRPAPPRRCDGLSGESLERALAKLPDDAGGRRDAALLLVMCDGMLRRSEDAALTWADVADADAGDGSGRLTIRRSKTDQGGEDAVLWLAERTVAALAAHVAEADRSPAAPMWTRGRRASEALSGAAVGTIVRRACETAGLSGRYSGHSLRRGTAEALAEAGEQLPAIMAAGRWSGPRMVSTYTAAAEAGRSATARVFGGRQRRRGRPS